MRICRGEGTARQEYLKSTDEYMRRGNKDKKLEEKTDSLRDKLRERLGR